MRKELLIALRVTGVTLVLTGLVYPLVTTGLAQMLFPYRAGGSFVSDERGQLVGSELLGQGFSAPGYFHPRPSAAGKDGWDATGSTGTNLGPTSKKLRDSTTDLLQKLRTENPAAPGPAPVELATSSGSGLDPHLSPAGALWQVPRVAQARHVSEERVRVLVESLVEKRDLLVLGEPRVNVLTLNLALDRQFGSPQRGTSATRRP
ncbi:MAG TPA: potassium-transporting ATPase subunit KdpC [Myxococcaceae bacterium]|nr:potassium-transporting ATPase subunit KdpC [Myxococcaceae bacterium]